MTAGRVPPFARCPTCGLARPFSAENPWRPFCGERCRAIDLGVWASEGYVIAGTRTESEGEAAHDEPRRSPPL